MNDVQAELNKKPLDARMFSTSKTCVSRPSAAIGLDQGESRRVLPTHLYPIVIEDIYKGKYKVLF